MTSSYSKMYMVTPAIYNQVKSNLTDIMQRRALEHYNPGSVTEAELSGLDLSLGTIQEENDESLNLTEAERAAIFSTSQGIRATWGAPVADASQLESESQTQQPSQSTISESTTQDASSELTRQSPSRRSVTFGPATYSTPLEPDDEPKPTYKCTLCRAEYINQKSLHTHYSSIHNIPQSLASYINENTLSSPISGTPTRAQASPRIPRSRSPLSRPSPAKSISSSSSVSRTPSIEQTTSPEIPRSGPPTTRRLSFTPTQIQRTLSSSSSRSSQSQGTPRSIMSTTVQNQPTPQSARRAPKVGDATTITPKTIGTTTCGKYR